MHRFLDGPAAGQALKLRRTPVMLRLVRDPAGKWDGLDQLEDEPRPDEEIFVYRIVGRPFIAFVDYRNRPGELVAEVEYRLITDQPSDSDVRTTDAWRRWCDRVRAGEIKADWSVPA